MHPLGVCACVSRASTSVGCGCECASLSLLMINNRIKLQFSAISSSHPNHCECLRLYVCVCSVSVDFSGSIDFSIAVHPSNEALNYFTHSPAAPYLILRLTLRIFRVRNARGHVRYSCKSHRLCGINACAPMCNLRGFKCMQTAQSNFWCVFTWKENKKNIVNTLLAINAMPSLYYMVVSIDGFPSFHSHFQFHFSLFWLYLIHRTKLFFSGSGWI